MRRHIRDWLATVAPHIPDLGPVLEVGSLQVHNGGGPELADLRPLFPGREYLGTDMRPGPGVDQVMDAESLPLRFGSIGTVLCIDTIEHVAHAWEACREFHRVLAPGGWAIVVTVFRYDVHDHPADYWRPTHEGMAVWLERFESVFVGGEGRDSPETIAGIGVKGPCDFPGSVTGHWKHGILRGGPQP